MSAVHRYIKRALYAGYMDRRINENPRNVADEFGIFLGKILHEKYE